jgi:hypothetical protein
MLRLPRDASQDYAAPVLLGWQTVTRPGNDYELGCEVSSAVGLGVGAGVADGSYSSADASAEKVNAEKVEVSPTVTGTLPPAIRTRPSDKSVAV